ncbi:MAG: helix-turn-helix domain-containing protein [Microcella pacifica]
MLSDDEIAALLALNHEIRVAEFKSAGSPANGAFLARVARACLAMANQRNGGHVLIGVDDSDPISGPSGVSDEDVASWLDFDTVSERINRYADPPLTLEVAVRIHPSGSKLVVIEVAEFGDSPVLCKRAFDGVLNLGQLYTRSIAKPESSQYHSQAELREVIDIAVEKGLRNFVARARNAGIALGAGDAEMYADRFASLFVDPDVQAIQAGMYFEMRLRPIPFEPTRIAFEDLPSTIQSVQIRRPGVTFPSVGYDFENSQHAITWRRPGGPHTVWRFDESGAFVFTRRLRDPGPDFDGLVDRDDPGVEGFVLDW